MSSQSRKKQIPGTLVLNWQPVEGQSSKPLIRRPVTACEACRSAKVKCNGQRDCERCKKRGLRCSYSPSLNVQSEPEHGVSHPSTSTGNRSTSTGQTQSDPMSVDTSSNPFAISESSSDMVPFRQPDNGLEQWGEETFSHALEEFDWVFPSCDLGLDTTGDTNPNGIGYLQSTNEALNTPTNIVHHKSAGQVTADPSRESSRPRPSYNCQCRANMMAQIPDLEAAIQELPKPQLDKMFKVTGDVIRSCQESTRCGCYVGPVDLVCIMTVFEQTAVCFDYIAKSGFDGTMKVGIGSYCVSLTDDASLKRTLVLDLVNQANELLDSVNALAQNMSAAQSEPGVKRMGRSPACLNQLNLHYVREATASFKKLFRLITDFFGERDTSR